MRRTIVAIFATAVLTAWTGTDVAAVPAESNREALREAMNNVVAAGAAGIQVRVHDEHGDWTSSAGVAELSRPDPVSTDGRFRIGSISKTFVATVLLQLVGEGRLGLDDAVDRYLPQFGLDSRISVRMLLQHTGGLFNYTGQVNPDGTIEPGLLTGKRAADSVFGDYSPEQLVELATSKPARFAPGSEWSYSNTNGVLAGLLIEKLTGTPCALQIYSRIVVPLGLWGTTVPNHETGILGPHAHGYEAYKQADTVKVVDFTSQNPSWAAASGAIISTTRDLDTFLVALLEGRLLAPALLAEMRTARPVGEYGGGYGLGLMQLTKGPGCIVVGHDGRVPGYVSDMSSTVDGRRRIEVSVTEGPRIDIEDPTELTQLLLAEIRMTALALCGD